MQQAVKIITFTSIISSLIPIFCYLAGSSAHKIKVIKYLFILLLLSFSLDITGYIVALIYKTNLFVHNVHTILQFFLLSAIFYNLLNEKKPVIISSIVGGVFFIVNAAFLQSFYALQHFSLAFGSIILIGYSIAYYFQLLNELPAVNILRFFPFWINVAVLYYFSASFSVFLISNYILTQLSPDNAKIIWAFQNINNILKNVLFAIAIYYAAKVGMPPKGPPPKDIEDYLNEL